MYRRVTVINNDVIVDFVNNYRGGNTDRTTQLGFHVPDFGAQSVTVTGTLFLS
jgi:hypothetical protein